MRGAWTNRSITTICRDVGRERENSICFSRCLGNGDCWSWLEDVSLLQESGREWGIFFMSFNIFPDGAFWELVEHHCKDCSNAKFTLAEVLR